MTPQPLARISSLKVKLGVLVAASVTVASVVATLGRAGGVPVWLSIPVTILLALAVTQLLAVGMTSPLRQMTDAARRMATVTSRATTPSVSPRPPATRSVRSPGPSTRWRVAWTRSTGSAASWWPT